MKGMNAKLSTKSILQPLSVINHLADFISARINNYNMKDTIVISGTPREGTTWLMEILETLPGYKSIFEPLHRDWYPKVKKLGLPARPYISPKREEPEIKDYFGKIFSGKVVSKKNHCKFSAVKHRLTADKLIIKFIRANRMLPWIAENFDIRGIYFLIRHPCAVIASQLETGIRGYFTPKEVALTKDLILSEILQIPELKKKENLIKKLKLIKTQEEVLAAIWSLDNYVPLSYSIEHSNMWYTVIYEKLIVDWEKELEKIFEYIGEEVPKEAYEKIRTPSMLTYDKSYIGTKKQLEKWKKKLSKKQVEKILQVVNWFGIDFYDENPEPDYEKLKHWKLSF